MCLALCQVLHYVPHHKRWGETITERLFSCNRYSPIILRQPVYSRRPHTIVLGKERQCTGTPRNALCGLCRCHEVDIERTQLIPHPPKSVGLQSNDRFSPRSRDGVPDAVGGRRDPFQCQDEAELHLHITKIHQQCMRLGVFGSPSLKCPDH